MKENQFLVKYVDPFTLLVINTTGQLRNLYTPFKVQCTLATGNIPINAYVYVEGVWQDDNEKLLYLVGGTLYPYSCFRLLVFF